MITPCTPQAADAVADHYDELDVFYREVWGEHVHHGLWRRGDETVEEAARRLVEDATRHARLKPDQTVCDVGCGYGATARHLAREHGAGVTGLTLSTAQHAYACAHTPGDNPVFLLKDWLANDLPGASFDAVVSIECVSHVPDKPRFFEEVHRVLKPGGRLVLCAWLAAEAPPAWAVRHLLEPICREGRLPGLACASEYNAMMEAAGLVVERIEDWSGAVRRTWTIIARRVLVRLLTDSRYARFLLDPHHRNRIFLLTVLRLWLGYRTGALRYGLFVAHRP